MDFLDKTCKKGLKQKKRTSPSNFTQSNQSGFHISASTHNFDFLKQICHKKEYGLKIKRVNITIEFFVFKFYVLNFGLTIFFFGPNLPKKACFQPKTDAKNNAIVFCIFELIQVANFFLNKEIKRCLGPKPKKVNIPIEFCILELV